MLWFDWHRMARLSWGSVKGCLFAFTRGRVYNATRKNSTLDHNDYWGFFFRWCIRFVGSYLVLVHSKKAPWKVNETSYHGYFPLFISVLRDCTESIRREVDFPTVSVCLLKSAKL